MKGVALRRLQIIVLAAGFSSRLGKPKALARILGLSLLRRTLQCAASLHPARIIAVVPRNSARYRSQARGMRVTFADNSQRHRGLSSSVRRGIAIARYAPAVLLMPVDLVNITSRELARLIRHWRTAPRCVIARRMDPPGGVRPSTAARPSAARGEVIGAVIGGTPLILPRRFYRRALNVVGDVGLRELMAQLPPDSRVLIDLPSAAIDIDTPEDLKAARRSFRRRSPGNWA